MALELDVTGLQRLQSIITRRPSEQTKSGLLAVRRRISPARYLNAAALEKDRQAELRQNADFTILFKNTDHEVSAADTADDLLKLQDDENIEYDVLGLQEIQVTSLDKGRTLDDVRLIADRVGMHVVVATPYYTLGNKRFALTQKERGEQWTGAIALLSRYPALPGSEVIYDLGRQTDSDDIGSKGGWDIYRKRWGVPIFIAASLKHPEGNLRVATTHFPTSTEGRVMKEVIARRFVELVDVLDIDVAGGDINASPRTSVARIVFDGTDRCDDGTDEPTYDGTYGSALLKVRSIRRLDAAVQGKNSQVEVVYSKTARKGTSDHKGIVVFGNFAA